MNEAEANTIRNLNDRFRRGEIDVPGRWLMTTGVRALIDDASPSKAVELIKAIAAFDVFDVDNDPWSEHDFGAFVFEEAKLFWKIDINEEPNVSGPTEMPIVTRVLTIMLADEY
jgi:Protein of unknown function (DUF3768)